MKLATFAFVATLLAVASAAPPAEPAGTFGLVERGAFVEGGILWSANSANLALHKRKNCHGCCGDCACYGASGTCSSRETGDSGTFNAGDLTG